MDAMQTGVLQPVFGRRTLSLVLGCAFALAITGLAFAWWTPFGSSSNAGAAQTGTMPAGITPTATLESVDAVRVSIPQVDFYGQRLGTLSGSGYELTRRPAGGGGALAPEADCEGLIAGSSATLECVEASVPAGSWVYSVTPVMRTWTGDESASSNAVTSSGAASDPPEVTVTTPAGPFVRGAMTVSADVVDQSGSGIDEVVFSYRATGAAPADPWSTICTQSAPSVGTTWSCAPIASSTLGDGQWDIRAEATDNESNTASHVKSVTVDNTAPAAAIPVVPVAIEGALLVVEDGGSSDALSGLDTMQIQYSASGAGGWSNFCLITAPAGDCNASTSVLTAGRTWHFRTLVTDNAGNSATSANASGATSAELLMNPGFENDPASTSWFCGRVNGGAYSANSLCGYDTNLGFAHGGANNAWVNGGGGNWMTHYQPVSTVNEQWYCISGWVRTANVFAGKAGSYFGLRPTTSTHNAAGLPGEVNFKNQLAYTRISTRVQADRASGLELFVGTWGESGGWARYDDFSMRAIPSSSAPCPVGPPPPPPAPSGLIVDPLGEGHIRLHFNGVSGSTGYVVYRAEDGEAFDYESPVSGAQPIVGSPWVDTSAEVGTTYRYVVRAVIQNGQDLIESADSNVSAAVTGQAVPPLMCFAP